MLDAGHPEPPDRPAAPHRGARGPGRGHGRRREHRRSQARHRASRCAKGLPLCGGQGGSAASAVAGAVAVNALLGSPLDRGRAARARASWPKRAVAGRHLDNIAPVAPRRDRADPLDGPDRCGPAAGAGRAAWWCWSGPISEMRTVRGAFGAAAARSRAPWRCIRRRRSARWSPRSRAATTRCSAERSTTVSPSRRGRDCCRASPRPRPPRSRRARWAARSRAAGPPRSRWRGASATAERIANAMVAAYARCGQRSEARIGQVDRQGRECWHRGGDAMRFETDRPPSWQACIACGNEIPELDPHPRCPRVRRAARGAAPGARRSPARSCFSASPSGGASVPGATASGVWRFREVVLPAATDVVSHPEGNTPLLHRPALDAWTGVDRLLLKHEGHNPTGSFKDRGMTVGVTQAVPHRRHARWRAPPPATPRRRSRPTRPRPGFRRSCSCRGTAWRWASWRSRSPTARGRCWCAATSTTASGSSRRPAPGSASTCSTRSIRSGSRGRRPSCSSCCSSSHWEPPDWIVLPGRQPRQHRRVREGAARGARAGD